MTTCCPSIHSIGHSCPTSAHMNFKSDPLGQEVSKQ
ncbi:hypothetical protein KIPB_014256, partial [Kipferlia bialata]|eukprot:g14256.t1